MEVKNIDLSFYDKYEIDFEKIRPQLLESIVSVYGEKHRETIEERLNTVYVNTYITSRDLEAEYNREKSTKEKLLTLELLKELGMEVSKETEESVFDYGPVKYNEKQKSFLQAVFDQYLCFVYKNGNIFAFGDESYHPSVIKEKRCKIFNYLGYNVTNDNYDEFINTDNGKKAFEEGMKIYNVCSKYLKKLEEFQDENKDIYDFSQLCRNEAWNIEGIKTFEYFKKILPYLPENEREYMKSAIAKIKDYSYKSFVTNKLDPNSIYSGDTLLEAFSNQMEEEMKTNKYYEDTVKNKRVKFFKLKGLDLGDDYSAYENSEEAKKLIPNQEFVEKIIEIKKQNDIATQNEILEKTSNYRKCREKMNALNLCADDEFGYDFVKNGVTAVCPNVAKNEDNKYIGLNVLNMPLYNTKTTYYRDVTFIHELLHIVELSWKQVSDKRIEMKTGFDFIDLDLEDVIEDNENQEYVHNIREYELLSENIHQLISIKVAEDLHEKGIYLFDRPEESKTRGMTSYEHYNSMTKPFMERFLII